MDDNFLSPNEESKVDYLTPEAGTLTNPPRDRITLIRATDHENALQIMDGDFALMVQMNLSQNNCSLLYF